MIRKTYRPELLVVLFLGLFAAGALVATYSQPPAVVTDAPTSAAQRGARVFQRERCLFCHSVRDAPAVSQRVIFPLGYVERVVWQWRRNGPDLNQMAGERTDDWLLAHFVQPGSIVAGCPMPSYAHLPDEDLHDLIAFIQQAQRPARAATSNVSNSIPIVPETRESYLAGRKIYEIYCAGCHGREGNGAGAVGHLLQPEPRDLSDAAWMRKRDDDYLLRIIAQGKPNTAMPGYATTLTVREQALVLYYLKFFADPSARQAMEEGLAR